MTAERKGLRERPKWFDYIRVRERVILGSGKPAEFIASFGPRNILTPQPTEEKMQRRIEGVKEWLWNFMQEDVLAADRREGEQGADDYGAPTRRQLDAIAQGQAPRQCICGAYEESGVVQKGRCVACGEWLAAPDTPSEGR